MADLDLVVGNGAVATAVGVLDGWAAVPGEKLCPGASDQPMTAGSRMADDFCCGTTAAACGGTTTVALAVGADGDADIAIWDRERQVAAANELLHHDVDRTSMGG